jgi:LysM repeat protein
MSRQPNRTPARLLAPLALAACAIAFFAVVLSAGGGDEDGGGGGTEPSAQTTGRARSTATETAPSVPSSGVYTVKTGDTLAQIAERVGVPVDRLQELNPELDPQALVSGQKIKLRE